MLGCRLEMPISLRLDPHCIASEQSRAMLNLQASKKQQQQKKSGASIEQINNKAKTNH